MCSSHFIVIIIAKYILLIFQLCDRSSSLISGSLEIDIFFWNHQFPIVFAFLSLFQLYLYNPKARESRIYRCNNLLSYVQVKISFRWIWPTLVYLKRFKSFRNCQHGWASNMCPKMMFLGPWPTLGSLYLIIDQIQVKLVSTQTYLGKVLLQSIVAPLDFPLSCYIPLQMWKKILRCSIW